MVCRQGYHTRNRAVCQQFCGEWLRWSGKMQRRGGKNAGGLRRTCAVKRQTAFGKRQNGAAARLPAASAWEGGRLADMPAGKKAARPQATSRGGREAPRGYAKAKR